MLGGGGMKNIVKKYKEMGNYSEQEMEVIKYAIKSISNDLTKSVMLFLIAQMTDTIQIFRSVFIPYITIRIFLGGIHMRTYWGCFWVTLGILETIVVLAYNLTDCYRCIQLFTCSSLFIVSIIGPMTSNNKKKLTPTKQRVFKEIALLIEILFLGICEWIVKIPACKIAICLSILVNNYQLLILFYRKKEM